MLIVLVGAHSTCARSVVGRTVRRYGVCYEAGGDGKTRLVSALGSTMARGAPIKPPTKKMLKAVRSAFSPDWLKRYFYFVAGGT